MVNKCIAYFYNHYVIGLFIATVFFTCFDIFATYMEYGRLSYADTDPYTRALRITDWLTDFQWFEKTFPFSNPPDGEVLHFTRICDILWTFFALPFFPFYSVKESVFYGGMIFSPFFFFLTSITICWGIRPFLQNSTRKESYFAFCLIPVLFIIYQYTGFFNFTRPDHHSLSFFIFCFNISSILHVTRHSDTKSVFYAGLLAGVSIWASSAIEGFIMLGSILSCFIILWIFYNYPCKIILKYSIGVCISVCLAFILNPPYGGYLVFDNSRLSFIHVTTICFIFISFFILNHINLQKTWDKLLLLIICTFCSLMVLFFIFGIDTIFSPIYHPNIKQYFLPLVSEMRSPMVHSPLVFIPFYLLSLYILFINIVHIKTQKHIALLCFLELWYIIPACITYRFLWYMIAPTAYLFFLSLYQHLSSHKKTTKSQMIVIIIAVLSVLMTFHSDDSLIQYDIPHIQGNILTSIFTGPQLAFENNIYTVTTPYHTNVSSITDNYTLFYSDDKNELVQLIKKHHVDYVYIPNRKKRKHYTPEQLPKKNITNQILTDRQDFPWLKKISTDKDNYYLYKINYDLL